jgi:hypothetical protein
MSVVLVNVIQLETANELLHCTNNKYHEEIRESLMS